MQYSPWQAELADAFRSPLQLLEFLGLADRPELADTAAANEFPFLTTRAFAERMAKGDPHDPLLRQVLSVAEEMEAVRGFGADPVGDSAALAVPGLLHKYQGRALLLATGACAIHCRYCFRRAFPYGEAQLQHSREQAVLDYLAANTGIKEVILSGGDPLSLSDQRLAALIARLESIPHLQRLRIHSRLPIVLPSRVTADFARLLGRTRLQAVVVVHANHAQEIGGDVPKGLARLRQQGVTLLNQAVLLAGVNDTAEVLAELSETLFRHGVLPYYLHLLDRAAGTAHFEVPLRQALDIHERLRAILPGYLLPRLVREEAGAASKLPMEHSSVKANLAHI